MLISDVIKMQVLVLSMNMIWQTAASLFSKAMIDFISESSILQYNVVLNLM